MNQNTVVVEIWSKLMISQTQIYITTVRRVSNRRCNKCSWFKLVNFSISHLYYCLNIYSKKLVVPKI